MPTFWEKKIRMAESSRKFYRQVPVCVCVCVFLFVYQINKVSLAEFVKCYLSFQKHIVENCVLKTQIQFVQQSDYAHSIQSVTHQNAFSVR